MGSLDTTVRTSWLTRLARLQPWYLLTKYPNRFTRSVFAFVNAGISIGIMTGAASYTDQPLIFPSLGPSAFLFFYQPSAPSSSPRNAILAHGSAILIGWLCFNLIGMDTASAQIEAVALSLGLLSALMIGTNLSHPPAASTTLIVSLGLITEAQQLIALMVAVVLLTVQAFVINRLSGVSYPIWKPYRESEDRSLVAAPLETHSSPAPTDPYAAIADQLIRRKRVVPTEGSR